MKEESTMPQHRTVGQKHREPASRSIDELLGDALRHHHAGRLSDAVRICRQILAIDARHAGSLHLLGMVAYRTGRHEAAVETIRKAIAIDNSVPSYHSNLGIVFQAQNKLDAAAACYKDALALNPKLAKTHYNLGTVLHLQRRLDEAATCYESALALSPELAKAHYNLGNVFLVQDKLDEAVASYERALALKPESPETNNNLGNALLAQDKLDRARVCYERALAFNPKLADAHYNLGNVFCGVGKLDEALVQYRRALALQPDHAQAGFAEAVAQLHQGDFDSGWRNFEKRWQSKDHVTPMRAYPQPLWSGGKLASGRLLIWGEQGVGDQIMFAGLVPDVIHTGTRCVLDCSARLKPLFARSFPEIEVVSNHELEHNHEFDIAAHLPSGSLPSLFRANNAAFGATKSPYLFADPVERERFRTCYADAGENRLIGLAWYTNNRKTGRRRSIDLSLFAPLFTRPDIRWISLQYGDHDALEKQAAAASAPLVIDRSVDQLANIDLFAAQIAALDMVITIDNSTAHLAGALGVSTWVLLPFAPDWRWLQARQDSPWYPTVRLFRQPKRDDWQSVVRAVQRAL
jgi:tetratricopeptide (TPR) repeat protein